MLRNTRQANVRNAKTDTVTTLICGVVDHTEVLSADYRHRTV